LPVHPRTQKVLSKVDVHLENNVQVIDPVGYFDMLVLEENARLIATDSGGVQREAYYLEVPCLTLRDETEWVATIETGWNKLVGADQKMILDAWFDFNPPTEHPPIYGNGTAGQRIAEILNLTEVHKMEHEEVPGECLHSLEGVNSK
jgi:UDP-GlcNAc3NAcA epimerase